MDRINKIEDLLLELRKVSEDTVISEKYSECIDLGKKILEISGEAEYTKGEIEANNTLGKTYFTMCDYESALDHFITSLKDAESINDTKGISFALNNMGIVYFRLRKFNKALEYYERSLLYKNEKEDITSISTSLNNIGLVYNNLDKPKKALNYFLRSLKIDKETSNNKALARALNNIGLVYKKLNDPERSLKSFEQSYHVSNSSGNKVGLSSSLTNLSIYYLDNDDYEKAIEKAKEGIATAISINSNNHLLHFYMIISEAYEKMGSFKIALDYYKQHTELKNEIFSDDLDKKLSEMQAKYEVDKKEKEAEIYRLRTEELAEMNKTKDKFFRIIHHDLLNPFSSIRTSSELLDNFYDKFDDEKRKKYIKMIFDSTTSITMLMENLFEWVKTQSGEITVCKEKIDVYDLIEENIALVKNASENKQIKVINNVSPEINIEADRNLLDSVVRNILSNAVKFTFLSGEININYEKDQNRHLIIIQDNGTGMDDETIEGLFKVGGNVSSDGTMNEKGTGLGLIVSKEFMMLNDGDIEVESEIGKGSKFILELPI